MRSVPPGWVTDLAILEHTGSVVDDRGDHLVVRSPDNPDFHWGNFLLVTDGGRLADAEHWVSSFRVAFPGADWVAVGLPGAPDDPGAWLAQGMRLEAEDVLGTNTLPRQAPAPAGYTVRPFAEDDWERSVLRVVAENARSGEHDPAGFERFARARASTRSSLCRRGLGAWFGAFAGDALVADLGIVRCGGVARYQDVSTDREHRGRGLASHLLGVAARWAGERGCDRWVIVTGASNPAGRVYRAAGFRPETATVEAYRGPDRVTPAASGARGD